MATKTTEFEPKQFALMNHVSRETLVEFTRDSMIADMALFMQRTIWVSDEQRKKFTVDADFHVDVRVTGFARVPATWVDMIKVSLFARWYNLATALVAWGLMSPVRYAINEYTKRGTYSGKTPLTIELSASECLPEAQVPPHWKRGPCFLAVPVPLSKPRAMVTL